MRNLQIFVVVCMFLLTGCGPSAQEIVEAQQRTEQARVDAQRTHDRAEIVRVLTLDDRTRSITDLARRVVIMQNIDTSACPPEFRTAYLDHIDAWSYLVKVRQARMELASDGSIEDALLLSLLASSNDTNATSVEDLVHSDDSLKKVEEIASERIDETFRTVQKIAIHYGAELATSH